MRMLGPRQKLLLIAFPFVCAVLALTRPSSLPSATSFTATAAQIRDTILRNAEIHGPLVPEERKTDSAGEEVDQEQDEEKEEEENDEDDVYDDEEEEEEEDRWKPVRDPYYECYQRINALLGPELDCAKVESEPRKLAAWRPPPSYALPLERLSRGNCKDWSEVLCLPTQAAGPEDARYPLAFVIIVERDVERAIRLFELLYQPQNTYCITYDRQYENETGPLVSSLAGCTANVILPDRHEFIDWAGFGTLAAAVNCLQALHHSDRTWHYAQIVSWNDAPLRTNVEMVKIFKLFNGTNDVELAPAQAGRFSFTSKMYRNGSKLPPASDNLKVFPSAFGDKFVVNLTERWPPPPGNVTMYKGSFAASLSRKFVEYILTDPLARELYHWLNGTLVPDESYWATLNHAPELGAPGGFPGDCEPLFRAKAKHKQWISRAQIWSKTDCKGKRVRGSCVYGIGDSAYLSSSPALMAHKFYPGIEPAAFHCLARSIRRRTVNPNPAFPLRFYERLPAVRYAHNRSGSCEHLAKFKTFTLPPRRVQLLGYKEPEPSSPG